MKHSKKSKLLALVLVLCLSVTIITPASAAGFSSGRSSSFSWSTILERLFGGSAQTPSTPEAPSEPETGSDTSTESGSTGVSGGTMTLVEDETTVSEGTALRASTYTLTNTADSPSTYASNTTLKYFPVTLYNYDKTTINNATHQVEVDNGLGSTWNGIYFSNGTPGSESYTEEVAIEDGTYIIQNARAAANNVGSWLVGNTNGITSTTNQSNATRWTVKSNGDGTYTLNSTNGYMTIGSGENGEKTATTASNIEIVGYTGDTYTGCVQLKSGSYYLCQWGGGTKTVYGGYDVNNDGGNAFYFYKVTDSGTEQVTFTTTASLSYAAWNFWNKGTGNNKYGQYTYSGLVESTLTANKDITFTKPDGGIFNSDATVKDIYTGVDMPFVYENGTYTFDASKNGVYFYADSTQGSTDAATALQNGKGRLYFAEGNTQGWDGMNYGDGSKNLWAPFNLDDLTGESSVDYHFGMRTTIPFTMTANGKMNPNDDESKDITFSFSGDDDVWIFIDGQLVIDLGGIHNRLDATINFAENTWSISESNSAKDDHGNEYSVADYNDAAINGAIFNDGDTTGILNQTRATFAASTTHELTIFYLERGAGSSNCKIQFNLPIYDYVSVTKRIAGTAAVENDVLTTTAGLGDLSETQKSVLNNLDFGFTLYKDGKPVAGKTYSLLNENNQVIATPSTDSKGHFVLKNGQTAKFTGAFTKDGNDYYVVEDIKDGFIYTTYDITANAAKGDTINEDSGDAAHSYYTYTGDGVRCITDKDAGPLQSYTCSVSGADEAEDSLAFVCENYMNASLPNPSALPDDDKVVIDYGLPVVIDISKNDYSLGDSSEVSFNNAEYPLTDGAYKASFGTFTYDDGKITYQLDKQLTGVEVIEYTLTSYAEATDGSNVADSGTAKVYIIPATSMYYEENFSGLVTYNPGKNADWKVEGSAQTAPQEPGVVGTVGDSPYGSDVAYLNDRGDSNGSSMYVETTGGAAQFSYTFTGTGTSFFARTGETAAYMRVVVTDNATNKVVHSEYRNNVYKATGGTTFDGEWLYNIPVFTYTADGYGSYTVTVTIPKATPGLGYGKDFYLDGIRVVQPLNSVDTNVSIAESAYATDGEANMTVVTLREKLIGEAQINQDDTISWNEGDNFVLFTDNNGEIKTAEEYRSNGPKEEVYLNNGQSITFSLTKWDPDSNKVYLGIKAPTGPASVSVSGHTLSLNNAADCYYDISSYGDITTDDSGVKTVTFEVKSSSGLVSVTNIKVTGSAEFVIVDQPDDVNIGGSEGGDIDASGSEGEDTDGGDDVIVD